MKIFLMCSGSSSLQVARALHQFLESIVYDVEYYLYTESIEPGTLWDPALVKSLSESPVGIACMTPDSLRSDWIHFESGSIASAARDRSRVIPFLVGVRVEDLSTPLKRFSALSTSEDDVRKLVQVVNALRPSPAPSEALTRLFGKFYPDFADSLKSVHLSTKLPKAESPAQLETLASILAATQRIEKRMSVLEGDMERVRDRLPTRGSSRPLNPLGYRAVILDWAHAATAAVQDGCSATPLSQTDAARLIEDLIDVRRHALRGDPRTIYERVLELSERLAAKGVFVSPAPLHPSIADWRHRVPHQSEVARLADAPSGTPEPAAEPRTPAPVAPSAKVSERPMSSTPHPPPTGSTS